MSGVENVAGFDLGNIVSQNSLIFSSLEFLFRFLPVFLVIFYLTPVKYRKIVLFIGSILMYACGEPRFVFLLLACTALNFLIGKNMKVDIDSPFIHSKWRDKKRRKWLLLALITDVGVLAFFKIGNVVDSNILLPLGISFYTFKMISYQMDVFRGKVEADNSFWSFGSYVCMFPQLTSGPIMRYDDASEELEHLGCTPEQFEEGLRLLVIGLGAKVLLADRLGTLWNDIQTIGFESISTPLAWLGAFTYSLQLYFDFEGYSLMAVGIGMMIGMPYIKNFDQPYMATSVSDFWRRWHMTLGSWFRDYVYIPMGGNRKGVPRLLLNLCVVWLLTGLWHGSGVNFLIWGITVGLFVIVEKLFYGKWLSRHKLVSHIYVWIVIPLTWVIFAVTSLPDLGIYFGRLFPFFGIGETLNPQDIFKYFSMYWWLLLAGIFFCIPGVSAWFNKHRKSWYANALLLVLFWMAVYQLTNAANNPFMYFRF
ncbi:MBOAT family O-acyltransferase [Eisenbergiella tayi]|uniref:MBOAT family O-acyltransferase n=1 Tax=Eisenbergiella tayi TaxID=1432052 RepID=UPI000849094F|nr:MBOAT family O-acyltransferase [Eisenbergiella tayi]ODR32364.1 alginate O-acetyltransferase [Eisenbergiella tayi]